jgi:thiamine monophosphate kinase
LDIYDIALHFGGDYELLVTIPTHKFEKVKGVMNKNDTDLIAIGEVTIKKEIIINDGRVKKILENKGYEHFTKHAY